MIIYDFLQARPLPSLLDECKGDACICNWCAMLKEEKGYQRYMSNAILMCNEDLKRAFPGLLIILVFFY